MKVIRFMDDEGQIRLGRRNPDGSADEVVETPEGGYAPAGRKRRIRRLLAPVRPPAVFCIGLNYRAHAAETGLSLPDYPVLFMKNPAAVIGCGEAVVLPECCSRKPEVDYEAELAVVIGRAAKNVPAETALDYVKGYTAGNDISARRWQRRAGGGQWVRAKSFDTFCPLGPVLATADEIPDPGNLALRLTLNGETMQDGHTSDMIFSVAEVVSYLSEDTTLLPGTVILTGTPAGVGYTRSPPVYLTAGDRLEVTIEKIGTLENPVVQA